jgi:hypothetical protein
MAKNVVDTDDVPVQTHIDEGGGAERGDTKGEEDGGGKHVRFNDNAKLAKEVGPVVCSRTMEEILMAKQGWFDHATVDKEVDMNKVVEDRGNVHVQVPGDDGESAVEVPVGADMARYEKGDDDVHIPVNDEGDVMAKHIDNEHDDQVPVEEGAELTKMLDQM